MGKLNGYILAAYIHIFTDNCRPTRSDEMLEKSNVQVIVTCSDTKAKQQFKKIPSTHFVVL